MNYLFNTATCGIFGIAEDNITIEKATVLIDTKTNKEPISPYEVGKTYLCVEKWKIRKGYTVIKEFDTEDEAKEELDKIKTELIKNGNTVIKV